MRTFLKGTVIALALAGATLATAGAANAQGYNNGQVGVQVGFSDVAIGYRDGYWDRHHHWNRWHHRHDYRVYQGLHGANYNDWNHDRDGGDGWVQPAVGIQGGYGGDSGLVQIDFNTVAFGYRDGYWDNGHQWHRWHNDAEYRNYRGHQGSNYHDWNHDRDHDMGWQR